MLQLQCATFEGIEAKVVDVELSVTKGLPSFSIVGMASLAISESKERVKSALLNNNFTFPPKRITINLSPSDLKKDGSHFDLAIALLIAIDSRTISLDLGSFSFFGELGLDGRVKENRQLFALVLSLANQNLLQNAIVPYESLEKLSTIPNVNFYGVKSLAEAIALCENGVEGIESISTQIKAEYLEINKTKYYYDTNYRDDFKDVKGQEVAKRAALISAAGMHNILFEGSPGCGKSMISKRLAYTLSPLSLEEILNIAKQESLNGSEPTFKALRPMRAPHHSSTQASIFGGGSHSAKIGEVALANHGLLFFDETPHFAKNVLEALREPLEDKKIRISRVNMKVEYPADFLFVAAMNPCPCGNLLHKELSCRCSDVEIQRYKNRLSEPFLDRIDLYVVMQSSDLSDKSTLTSKDIHEKVIEAFRVQKERGQENLNGKLSDEELEKFCTLTDDAEVVLEKAVQNFSLSFRAMKKVLKVARTIADLESRKNIDKLDVLEALSYRKR